VAVCAVSILVGLYDRRQIAGFDKHRRVIREAHQRFAKHYNPVALAKGLRVAILAFTSWRRSL
jgi:hypothetical protein